MSMAPPLPTVIGPTENALRALLLKTLATTRIKSYSAWVILNSASNQDTPSLGGRWRNTVANALKVELDVVDDTIIQLCDDGLVDSDGQLTALGTTEPTEGRAAVPGATARLVEGLGEEDQRTARLVPDHIRRKADELLGP